MKVSALSREVAAIGPICYNVSRIKKVLNTSGFFRHHNASQYLSKPSLRCSFIMSIWGVKE